MGKIKFGIVGCGHIGKRHAEMISRNNDTELVAMCDVLPKEKVGIDQYNVPFYSSIEEMLASKKDIEIVSVCTPNGLHATHAIKALEAKKACSMRKAYGSYKIRLRGGTT